MNTLISLLLILTVTGYRGALNVCYNGHCHVMRSERLSDTPEQCAAAVSVAALDLARRNTTLTGLRIQTLCYEQSHQEYLRSRNQMEASGGV